MLMYEIIASNICMKVQMLNIKRKVKLQKCKTVHKEVTGQKG